MSFNVLRYKMKGSDQATTEAFSSFRVHGSALSQVRRSITWSTQMQL